MNEHNYLLTNSFFMSWYLFPIYEICDLILVPIWLTPIYYYYTWSCFNSTSPFRPIHQDFDEGYTFESRRRQRWGVKMAFQLTTKRTLKTRVMMYQHHLKNIRSEKLTSMDTSWGLFQSVHRIRMLRVQFQRPIQSSMHDFYEPKSVSIRWKSWKEKTYPIPWW